MEYLDNKFMAALSLLDDSVNMLTGYNAAVLSITDVGVNDAKAYFCGLAFQGKNLGTASETSSVIRKHG